MTNALVTQETGIQQPSMTEDQVQLLKDTICKGASDDEFKLFLHVVNRTRLDPFAKQIYAMKRRTKDENGNWKESISFQTGIDGFRLIAERSHEMDGQDGPFWCGADGVWKEVWLDAKPPAAAKVTVFRKGQSHGYTGVANYTAYAQTTREGAPTKFWAMMPAGQLAKCAESLALRKAFPQELSGLYTHEEMQQADGNALPIKDATKPALPPTTPVVPEGRPAEQSYEIKPAVNRAVAAKMKEATVAMDAAINKPSVSPLQAPPKEDERDEDFRRHVAEEEAQGEHREPGSDDGDGPGQAEDGIFSKYLIEGYGNPRPGKKGIGFKIKAENGSYNDWVTIFSATAIEFLKERKGKVVEMELVQKGKFTNVNQIAGCVLED